MKKHLHLNMCIEQDVRLIGSEKIITLILIM